MVHFDHTHVVRLLGIVREGGFMLVTEFVRMGALRKALRARNKAGNPMNLPTYVDNVCSVVDSACSFCCKKTTPLLLKLWKLLAARARLIFDVWLLEQ